MSTRVCYMIRDERGGRLRSLRLVGQGVDRSFPPDGAAESKRNSSGIDIDAAAAWLRDELEQARSTKQLTMLVLDESGSVCSWVNAPSFEPRMVAAAARGDIVVEGDDQDEASSGARERNPVTYFAADPMEALVQPLQPDGDGPDPLVQGEPRRVALLAAADTPARLLIDALDAIGIIVEQVTSVWQAASLAWDRASGPETRRSSILPDASPATSPIDAGVSTAANIVAEHGRLLWSWSRAGRLVCGGTLRIAPAIIVPSEDGEMTSTRPASPLGPVADEADVPRLIAEWLAWSIQTGAAPSRITCILAAEDGDDAAAESIARFGNALGTRWAGATVDVVTSIDPVGATLRRLSEVLDSTPSTRSATGAVVNTGPSVVGLSSLELRPGRSHRRMYIWASVALTALAAGLGVISWRMSNEAAKAKIDSKTWETRWKDVTDSVFPDAIRPGSGLSASMLMSDEVRRLEDARKPADRAEPALPVMQELESLSYVLSDPNYNLESVEIDSKSIIRLVVIAPDIASAELMLEAINALAGTNSVDWSATYRARNDRGESKVTATFTAKWNPALFVAPSKTAE